MPLNILKMLFNILTFHSNISGVYLWVFMISLFEINVKGFLLKHVKRLLYMVKITEWNNWQLVQDIGHF